MGIGLVMRCEGNVAAVKDSSDKLEEGGDGLGIKADSNLWVDIE